MVLVFIRSIILWQTPDQNPQNHHKTRKTAFSRKSKTSHYGKSFPKEGITKREIIPAFLHPFLRQIVYFHII